MEAIHMPNIHGQSVLGTDNASLEFVGKAVRRWPLVLGEGSGTGSCHDLTAYLWSTRGSRIDHSKSLLMSLKIEQLQQADPSPINDSFRTLLENESPCQRNMQESTCG